VLSLAVRSLIFGWVIGSPVVPRGGTGLSFASSLLILDALDAPRGVDVDALQKGTRFCT